MIHQGDCLEILRTMSDKSVNCCVTSPPYYGLRDYGVDGQIGLEQTPDEYVSKLVEVFREVRRVLRDDGTLWLNIGDCYVGANNTNNGGNANWGSQPGRDNIGNIGKAQWKGLPSKNLIGIPWMVALALRADGWFLRQDIIWSKPNPMPESVKDRCTKSHEYIFMLSKSQRYYCDMEAIKEEASGWNGSRFEDGKNAIVHPNVGINRKQNGEKVHGNLPGRSDGGRACNDASQTTRNKRSVWTVSTQPYAEAHFATFPPDLIKPCILAGCPEGGIVLDPFAGSGTTGEVAVSLGRNYELIELNPEYIELIKKRINSVAPLFHSEK